MEEVKITNKNGKVKIYIDGEKLYPPTKSKKCENVEEIKITDKNSKTKIYINSEKVYPPTKPKKYKDITLEDLGFTKYDNEYKYEKDIDSFDNHESPIIIKSDENLIIEPGSIVHMRNYYHNQIVPFIKCYGKITAVGTKNKSIKFTGPDAYDCCGAIELIKSKNSHFEYCEFCNMIDLVTKRDREDYLDYRWDGRGDTPFESGFALNCYRCKNLIVKNCKAYDSYGSSTDPIYEHKCYNTTVKNLKIYRKDDYEDDDEEWELKETINESSEGYVWGP